MRTAWRAGGDGESLLKVDLRNAAGFVRLAEAQVKAFMLPIKSLSLDMEGSYPALLESQKLQKYIM